MITVRYFAGARAAAGVATTEFPAGLSIADLVERASPELAKVYGAASFLVDGLSWKDRHEPLPTGCTLDVLPPFAGG
ncbi:MoaD/ThiS family protein [Hamadaea tsunoensis]|uniref:MoaD/ThiS family protein n=1 Tax=Hamadaea tsunoensis TaxID=53368 RepID=UPI000415BDDB|nr:MoaD/ThiS family protein [Hamadaea tsunoensis]